MRYNDEWYVNDWKTNNGYPKIHNDMFTEASKLPLCSFVDLCSSTGLLGRRLVNELGWVGCAVESSDKDIALGVDGGVYAPDFPYLKLKIGEKTINELQEFLEENSVTCVVARRCISVLYEIMPMPVLEDCFIKAGVTSIILEGLKVDVRSVHPIATADLHAAQFPAYRTTSSLRDVRVLELV